MKYTIGEVANFLHLSRDMIRYYEKRGVIVSERNENNNYRTYDNMAVFELLDTIQHKNLNLSIREIEAMRQGDYEHNKSRYLDRYYNELKSEISYGTALLKRIDELKSRYDLREQKIGNSWIKSVSGHYRYHIVDSRKGEFGSIELTVPISEVLFSDYVNPFVDYGFTSIDDMESWYAVISESYTDELSIDLPHGYKYEPEGIYLCSLVNIGSVKKFDMSVIDMFRKDASENYGEMVAINPVRGIIASRIKKDGELHVVMELQIKIG
nr:MerR family DNA-binding transcriptional regulator [uncultured Mogibacterium sp.]